LPQSSMLALMASATKLNTDSINRISTLMQ